MSLCAAVARFRVGELLGGNEGATLRAAAEQRMHELGVTHAEIMAQIVAPGFTAGS